MPLPKLIIDFDSTFVTVESLDELAGIALAGRSDRIEVLERIADITKQGMEGKIGFAESLFSRLQLFRPSAKHLEQLIVLLHDRITPSVLRNRDFFKREASRIYIISGGFTNYILPVVADFGLSPDHVLANRFRFSRSGDIIGYDENCLLSQDKGKVKQLVALQLEQPVYIIGDGYSDYEVREAGLATKFLAFTENIRRPGIIDKADGILSSFDELLGLAQDVD